MSVAALLELNLRRGELAALVDVLTLPQKENRLGPTEGRGEVLPLLTALEAEQTSRRGAGERSTTLASTRAPVRLSATELLVEIDRATGNRAGRGRIAAVRAWSARVGSSGELGAVADGVESARRWVESARNVIARRRRYLGLRGATCPRCGHSQVVVSGSAGEDVVEPALAADTTTGVVSCAVADCGAAWPADQLEHLAGLLATQTSVEVLAVD